MTTDQIVPMYSVALAGDTTATYADLNSIQIDFGLAAVAFELVAADTTDSIIPSMVWGFGVVSYRRAFTSGKNLIEERRSREQVPAYMVENIDDEYKVVHEEILEQANRHFAHRVNGLEQTNVLLILSNPAVRRQVEGITPFFARYMRPVPEFAEKAAVLARGLEDMTRFHQNGLAQAMIISAQQRDVEEWYRDARPMADGPPFKGNAS